MAHSHHFQHRKQRLFWSILLNLLITAGQVVAGIISGSLALLSDALHNFSDVTSLIISYVATRLMDRKNTARQTFGYKRSEIVAAFINAFSLTIIGVFLIKEAIARFQEQQEISPFWVMGAASLGIIANGITVWLLHAGSDQNLNQKAAYLHMFTDMLTSIAVLLGGMAIYFFKWYWVDPVLTMAIAVYLLYLGWKVVVQSLRILMQFSPEGIEAEQINQTACTHPEVKNMHHLHLWQLNETDIYLEAHVEFKEDLSLSQANRYMGELEAQFKSKFGITHVTIQAEYQAKDTCELIVQPEDHPSE